MNIKKDKQLIKEAIYHGCKTAAELAHFIKAHTLAAKSYHRI